MVLSNPNPNPIFENIEINQNLFLICIYVCSLKQKLSSS